MRPHRLGRSRAGGWLLDPALLAQRAARLAAAVAEYAAANPLEPGMPLTTARRLAGMPDPRLVELLLGSQLTLTNGRVHRAGSAIGLPDAVRSALDHIRSGADGTATQRLRTLPNPFTLSQARQALDTTRRVAIPLLEHLANHGITHRLPDGTHELSS
ncbi:MAG: SelB C-terminal domain-containing protein [Pseudonocardiaceae bacterium]